MRRIVTVAIVLAVCAPLSASGSSLPSLPTSVAPIVAAALAQKSVHRTMNVHDMGDWSQTTSDASADSGRLLWTERGRRMLSVRLVDHTVYLRGNEDGLFGTGVLSRGQAARYLWRWISIPSDDEAYAEAADGLTLASLVQDVIPQGQLSSSREPAHGTQLLVIQGKIAEMSGTSGTLSDLTADVRGKLPVAFHSDYGRGETVDGTFSRWNEPVHVHAPASSTPIATVRG